MLLLLLLKSQPLLELLLGFFLPSEGGTSPALVCLFFSSRFLRLIVLLLRFLQGNPGLTHPGQLLGSRNGSLKKCIQDDETNMLNMASLAINRYQVSIEFGDQQQSIVIKVVL